jgi:hypothetical protein
MSSLGQKRTLIGGSAMSAKCQKRTSCEQKDPPPEADLLLSREPSIAAAIPVEIVAVMPEIALVVADVGEIVGTISC